MVQELIKKQDIVEYLLHEVELLSLPLTNEVDISRTPLAVMSHFSPSGEEGLVSQFLNGDMKQDSGFENRFAVHVAEFRDTLKDVKAQTLVDFLWSVWGGTFDAEVHELCVLDMQPSSQTLLWHKHFQDSAKQMAVAH